MSRQLQTLQKFKVMSDKFYVESVDTQVHISLCKWQLDAQKLLLLLITFYVLSQSHCFLQLVLGCKDTLFVTCRAYILVSCLVLYTLNVDLVSIFHYLFALILQRITFTCIKNKIFTFTRSYSIGTDSVLRTRYLHLPDHIQ
jgi:hypothetical protein